jgi:hypothetical protein
MAMNPTQRRLAFCLIGTSFVLGQAACNSSSDNNSGGSQAPGSASPGPTPSSAPSATPSSSPANGFLWNQVSEQTECGGTDPSECAGFYGFTISNDGTYEIGPSPSGVVMQGTLTTSEFGLINRDASLVAGETLGSEYTCESSQFTPATQDNIGILFPGQSTGTVVYQQELATQGSNCFLGAGPNEVQLHSDMRALMLNLYTLPFPPVASPSPSFSPSPTPSESVTPSPSPSPSSSGVSTEGTAIATGTWGGEHVKLDETKTEAKFTFECAKGQTTGPIEVNSDGKFSVAGTYSITGGPEIQGAPQKFSATYTGTVEDNTMDLTVTYTDANGQRQQTPYELDFGDKGTLNQLCIE